MKAFLSLIWDLVIWFTAGWLRSPGGSGSSAANVNNNGYGNNNNNVNNNNDAVRPDLH